MHDINLSRMYDLFTAKTEWRNKLTLNVYRVTCGLDDNIS